jgi:hypothetical protein
MTDHTGHQDRAGRAGRIERYGSDMIPWDAEKVRVAISGATVSWSTPSSRARSLSRAGTNAGWGMRVYSYVIDHDLGFAPNPFYGICTLAACKPKIRQYTEVGDYIVGAGSRPNGGRLIYWMRIDEIDFDRTGPIRDFAANARWCAAASSCAYGDNIYHRDPNTGHFIQDDSFHSEPAGQVSAPNLRRDTGTTDRVLLAREFAYCGAEGPVVPADFLEFVHRTQGDMCCFPPEWAEGFVAWLREQPARGCVGDPTNWTQ